MSSHKKLPNGLQIYEKSSHKPYLSNHKSNEKQQSVFNERRISNNNSRHLRQINENPLNSVQLRLSQQHTQPNRTSVNPTASSLKTIHKNLQTKTSTNLVIPSSTSTNTAQKSQRSFVTSTAARQNTSCSQARNSLAVCNGRQRSQVAFANRTVHKTSLTYVKDKENFIQREKVEEDGSYTYRITEERPALLTKGS